jgi:hypothetical protein
VGPIGGAARAPARTPGVTPLTHHAHGHRDEHHRPQQCTYLHAPSSPRSELADFRESFKCLQPVPRVLTQDRVLT